MPQAPGRTFRAWICAESRGGKGQGEVLGQLLPLLQFPQNMWKSQPSLEQSRGPEALGRGAPGPLESHSASFQGAQSTEGQLRLLDA